MADPRYRSTGGSRDDDLWEPNRTGYGAPRDYGSGRDYTYSSARDYEAAGMIGNRGRPRGDEYRDRSSGAGNYRPDRGSDWDRDYSPRGQSRRHGQDYDHDRGGDQDRGFLDRAGDEIRSWFGDEEAERRRERDMRQSDHDYHNWRSRQVADLDRDYAEYRRENAQKFENEFGSWRTERQGQRTSLQRVHEHMEVIGSDGAHVGKVDKVRGDRIILTKTDANAAGHHHSIPSRWIESVVDDKVTIRKTADQAKAHWRDEERSGAFFGDNKDDQDNRSAYYYRSWMAI